MTIMPIQRFWLALLLCSLLIGGCGTASGVKIPQGDSSNESQSAESGAPVQLQSGNERNMVVLFRILLEMNRFENDSVTRMQAEQMLPWVKNGISKGGLTDEEYERIVGLFNDRQKSRFKQLSERWNSRARSADREEKQGRNRVSLSPDDELRLEDEFQKRRSSERMGEYEGYSDNTADSYFFSGKNLEGQVVEMLQSKLK